MDGDEILTHTVDVICSCKASSSCSTVKPKVGRVSAIGTEVTEGETMASVCWDREMLGKYGTSLAIYVPGSYVRKLEGRAVLGRRSVETRTGGIAETRVLKGDRSRLDDKRGTSATMRTR